ncbi:MAG TPA: phosphatidylinositol mannoside acyltransferase [Actinomycetes bacterium]|nr:phosphatidylinositol mannoside acyltransferase [Actinomycetes bacterium]
MKLPSVSTRGVTDRVTGRVASWGYEAGWTLSRRLPESVVGSVFEQIGAVAAKRGGRSVTQLRRNLSRARPDLDAEALDDLTNEAMKSYLRYWREAFRLPEWSRAEVERRMSSTNESLLFENLESGRGVVAVLGHFGNWDHAGAWVTGRGYSLTTVAERLKPESLYDQFVAYRESLGMHVLPLSGGSDVSRVLQERLANGELVALLADRDLTTTGIEVDLLGEPARMPVGPALLALRTGAVLLPVISWYEGEQTHLDFHAPLTSSHQQLRDRVSDLTQQWADIVGQAAKQHARDWHMLQPIWSADRPTPRADVDKQGPSS